MDFTLNDDQTAIRDLAAQIFKDQVTDEYLQQFSKDDRSYDETLWQLLADQGLLGLAVPESAGGSGQGFTELCLMMQEQGRRLAPIPLLSNLVLAGLPLAEFASDEQQMTWLAPMAGGQSQLTAALAELGMSDAIAQQVTVTSKGAEWTLNGELQAVPYGAQADAILVPVSDADGQQSVFIVATNTAGVELEDQVTSLGAVQATIRLNNVVLGADSVLGKPGQGAAIVEWIEQRANTVMAGMQVGTTEEALRRTAEYTGERKQFGVPIGSFQAVAMRAADAYINIEAMRSTYWQAMWRISEGLAAEPEVRAAKYWACVGAHHVVYTTQHLHGGIGVDIEFPIHRYFLFAKQVEFMLGGRTTQLRKMGEYLAQHSEESPRWMVE